MKTGAIIRRVLAVYREHWGDLMTGLLVELALRLMVLAPLLFLAERTTATLALLTPTLFVLIVLPARQNAAIAMKNLLTGGRFCTPLLVSFEHYGRKLRRGLRRGLLLLLWGLPCLSVTGGFLAAYNGLVDVFTLMRFFMTLGGGKFSDGVVVGLGIYAATFLPLLLGLMLHSWRRHGDAWGLPGKAVRGWHGRLLAGNIMGALALLPFFLAAAWICKGVLSQLTEAVSGIVSGSGAALPSLGNNLGWLGAAFVLLFLPLLPLKNLFPAVLTEAVTHASTEKADAA